MEDEDQQLGSWWDDHRSDTGRPSGDEHASRPWGRSSVDHPWSGTTRPQKPSIPVASCDRRGQRPSSHQNGLHESFQNVWTPKVV